ncbi:MAG: VWA domain-containing protein [Anaerolineae bacterium]
MDVEKDYYSILGVSLFATPEQIKHEYRELARRYHPDSRDVETPTTLFHEIHEAYAVLSDDSTRRLYDRRRNNVGTGERAALAWNLVLSRERLYSGHEEQVLYALLQIGAAAASVNQRLPLDLSIVIDRSTSMRGARLEQVKEAARQIVDELDDEDSLAIVSFSDRAEVVLSGRVGTNRAQAGAGISALHAEGGTELLQGLTAGLEELGAYRRRDAVGHLILLTDGRTYGDDEACIAAAEEAAQRGIGITAMGIGTDWNDELLDEIASRTGGTSAYIASPGQVRPLMKNRVRSLGAVFAKRLALTVRNADDVRVESAFQTSPSLESIDLSEGKASLGSLAVDEPVRILFEIAIQKRSPGEHRLLQFELNGDVPSLDRRGETLRRDIRCVFTDDESNRGERNVPPAILSALSKVTLYRMQEQAWVALREGRVKRATHQLEMVATRLLDMGEKRLARAAMLEAEHIAKKGSSTDRGRKEIKYGTRSLDVGREAHD